MSDHLTALEASRLRQPLPEVIATEFDELQNSLITKLRGIAPGQQNWFDWLGLGLTDADKILLPCRRPRRGQDASYTWSGKYRDRAVAMWRALTEAVTVQGLKRLTDDELARWLLAQGQHHESYVREAIGCSADRVLKAVDDYLWHRYGRNIMTDCWLTPAEYDVYREVLKAQTGVDGSPNGPRMWATLLWQRHRLLLAYPDKTIQQLWVGRFFTDPLDWARWLVRAEHNEGNVELEWVINETIWDVTPNNPIAYQLLQQWYASSDDRPNVRPCWNPIQFRLVQVGVYHNRFVGWLALQGAARNWLQTLSVMPKECTTEFMAWVLLQLGLTTEFDQFAHQLPRRDLTES